jgi:hypothetical protein
MWSSSFYFGNFVGPTVAGVLVENNGFRSTTVILFSLYIFVIIVDSLELAYNLKYVKVPEKEGYIDLEEKENEKTEEKVQQ